MSCGEAPEDMISMGGVPDVVEYDSGRRVGSTRIAWIGRRQSARGCLRGEGVEISDQVVDQFYMGVRGECW